jgi:hypothetical protein
MKNLKIEIKDQNDKIVGYVFRYRGPSFADFATCYTPLDLNGNPLPSCTLVSFEKAKNIVLASK